MMSTSKRLRSCLQAIALCAAFLFPAASSFAAEWKMEIVDQTGSGRFTSMKIDKNGNVHVAYVPEAEQHPLRYAFWDHTTGRWFTMTVAKYASFCTLALDSKQRPHISYATHGTGKGAKLRYVYWDGTAAWVDKAISPAGDSVVGYYTSIALDANDSPSFSYYDYDGPPGVGFTIRLRSVFWNGQYWEVRMVDPQMGSGKFNSIAVDSKGHPMIAYANVKAESSGLRFASWDGNAWHTEILEGIGHPQPMQSVSLVVDKNDNPHITYSDVDRRLVKYATRQNGKWELQVVDRVSNVGYPDRNGIALDEEGNVYMSYYDTGNGILKVAWSRNGKWYSEILANGYAGFTSSLQVHDGMLWIAFADDSTGVMKVAHRPLEVPVPVPPSAPGTAPAKLPSK
jgi:hypothetical protein